MPTRMPADGDTWALYRFDEASGDALDASGNSRTLTAIGAPGAVTGFPGFGSTARRLSATEKFRRLAEAAIKTWADGGGGATGATIEALLKVVGGGTPGAPILAVEHPDTTWGLMLRVYSTFVGLSGGGGAPGWSDQVGVSSPPAVDEWYYLAVTTFRSSAGADDKWKEKFNFHVNGILVGMTNPDVGGSSTPAAKVGSDLLVGDFYGTPTGNFNNAGVGEVHIAEMRLSTRVRTPAEVIEQAIAYELLGAAGTPEPTIELQTAEGEVAATDPIVVDVDGFMPQKPVVSVRFLKRGTSEVPFDGTDWGPGYETSTRVEISATALRFTLRRAGGWPEGEQTWKVGAVVDGNVI